MGELLKINLKLLLRNKGFLFFLCITPMVSALILNLKLETALHENKELRSQIVELEDCSDRAAYAADTTAFVIKVYDASETELSEYVLEQLATAGMFSVCRCDVRGLTDPQVEEQAKKDAFDDRAGTLLYLKKDFEPCVLEGDYAGAMQIYDVSEDERWELFETELTQILCRIHYLAVYEDSAVDMASEHSGSAAIHGDVVDSMQVTADRVHRDSSQVLAVLHSMDDRIPEKQVITLSGKQTIALTDEQINQKFRIGYAFAIITLGFLFCGVYVAHTVIEEENNKVYTRVMLSGLSRSGYLGSKFMVTLVVAALQTVLLGICVFAGRDSEFGIHKGSFLFLIFCLGLIFGIMALLAGILLGDVMSANYAVFAIWSVSGLLGGVYFSLDDTSQALKTLSFFTPQRWFLKASEMLLAGDKTAFSMVLYITVAYLIGMVSVGAVGLKVKRSET
ncbi:MAG: ABC transporter permease [Lachnospiraceae bacterium]|nr:ABC transporter permease [Lachnospiraceae bacterium]